MKSVSADLNNYLNNEKNFQTCDLYKLKLKSGSEYYIADYDKDVVFNGHSYNHNLGMMKRGQTKLSGTPSVDSMTVTLVCDKDDKIETIPMMKACHLGLFDQAVLTISKAYFYDDAVVGGFEVFSGICEVSEAGGLRIKLTVKSIIQGLSQLVPVRIFAPAKAYTNIGGTITTSNSDTSSALIPLKPSERVLIKL